MRKKEKTRRKRPLHKGTISKGTISKGTTTRRIFKKKDFYSGDGMLTTVWGPPMWHYLHTMSFNYPVHPTPANKKEYRDFVLSLRHTLPCKYCRQNLTNNLKAHPLTHAHMQSRDTFSRFIYQLHETVNKMLGKTSGLSYCDVRERYEHFRSRCTSDQNRIFQIKQAALEKEKEKEPATKEKGCTEPLYSGKKAKCVMQIVPQEEKCETFQVKKECIKKLLN
jgi:hypothetical protein